MCFGVSGLGESLRQRSKHRRKNRELKEVIKVPVLANYIKSQRLQFDCAMWKADIPNVRAAIDGKKTKRQANEEMDRRDERRSGNTKSDKFERLNTESGRLEGSDGGSRNSHKIMKPVKRRRELFVSMAFE